MYAPREQSGFELVCSILCSVISITLWMIEIVIELMIFVLLLTQSSVSAIRRALNGNDDDDTD